MSVKLSSIQVTTEDAEWVDLIEIPEVKLKVRALDYGPYQIARDLLLQKFARQYGRKPIPREKLIPALGRLYADHILVDWDGFDEKYSLETAKEKLADWSWRKLVAQIEWAAGTLSDVNAEFVEQAAKNSEPPSAST